MSFCFISSLFISSAKLHIFIHIFLLITIFHIFHLLSLTCPCGIKPLAFSLTFKLTDMRFQLAYFLRLLLNSV